MSYSVSEETFDSLDKYWQDSNLKLNWSSIFVLPAWLSVWWQVFNDGAELYLRAVRQEKELIGLAPLQVKNGTACFVGNADVCDFLDFITVPGRETNFFDALLNHLKQNSVNRLDLESLRPESTVLTHLADFARGRGYPVSCQKENVSLEMNLPPAWEEFLAIISKKQRHELKRKLKRLEQAGKADYRCVEASHLLPHAIDTFLKLFSLSREEKASFMTERMASFFRLIAKAMAEKRLLRLGTLTLDSLPTAMIMGFDYNDSVYLYNCSYDPGYKSLSVGLLSKVLCLKESITMGKKKWDFLKGDEAYKYHFGGQEIPIYRCRITIN